jgi:hypothetical protein
VELKVECLVAQASPLLKEANKAGSCILEKQNIKELLVQFRFARNLPMPHQWNLQKHVPVKRNDGILSPLLFIITRNLVEAMGLCTPYVGSEIRIKEYSGCF